MPPAERPWPDTLDLAGIAAIGGLLVVLPLAGYLFAYLDFRAYLRSLRRALVLVGAYTRALPSWVHKENPPCLAAFGLSLGCTREEVLAAYRERVKVSHPDLGGSRTEFARLQAHFEEAMQFIEAVETRRR